jgi:hypothetical protein
MVYQKKRLIKGLAVLKCNKRVFIAAACRFEKLITLLLVKDFGQICL